MWLSACASAAGIVAATALRSERVVMPVAPTCFSWATSGACRDGAAASRACRWALVAGRLVSWSSNTTTMRSCLPDERDLTWLVLSLEKLGFVELAGVALVAPSAVPAAAAVKDIARPAAPTRAHNRVVFTCSLPEHIRMPCDDACADMFRTLDRVIDEHNGSSRPY